MLKDRAFKALNLDEYSNVNKLDKLGTLKLSPPKKRQYVLRMLIKRMFGEYKIPKELLWIKPLLEMADLNQSKIGVKQPFVYLTIRNGIVDSKLDDDWHVDGFSKNITHLPEQNYIWTNRIATEYVEKAFCFPANFDPLKHNIHSYFQNFILDSDIIKMKEFEVYGLDPYIVHRRPKETSGIERCFVRLSYTPIEIDDCNNTFNKLIPTDYKRDGVKDVRDKLIDYKIKPLWERS